MPINLEKKVGLRYLVHSCFRVLSTGDKKRLSLILAFQAALSLLDLFGVALLGVLGALAVSGIESSKSGNRVGLVLRVLHISYFGLQNQIFILGVLSAVVLLTRTFVSIFFTKKSLNFLSNRAANLGSNLFRRYLSQNLLFISKFSSQEALYILTKGADAIILGVVGTVINSSADIILLTILMFGLLVVNPLIAVLTFSTFSVIGISVYLILHTRVSRLSKQSADRQIKSNEKILEAIMTYRETSVRDRKTYYFDNINRNLSGIAKFNADLSFIPFISKYVLESSIVLGTLFVIGAQFYFQDAKHAVGSLAIFMASVTRIAPALMRIQQGALQIKSSQVAATMALKMDEDLLLINNNEIDITNEPDFDFDKCGADIIVSNLGLRYPGKLLPALSDVNVNISRGKFVAVVGPSGAGKTTFVDLLLGVLVPTLGEIRIGGRFPNQIIRLAPGAIGYVPQEVRIIDGSIRENVAQGFSGEEIKDSWVWDALKVANLDGFVRELPEGLNSSVGENGSKLSGGQRQRLGIARAMYTKPKLLVLDEATSALDVNTEMLVSESLRNLRGSVTLIMIAHRLSTVRDADQVLYFNNGELKASGTFNEVRSFVRDFDRQVRLMGI